MFFGSTIETPRICTYGWDWKMSIKDEFRKRLGTCPNFNTIAYCAYMPSSWEATK